MKRKDMSRREEANNDRDAVGRAKDARGFNSREAEKRTFEVPKSPIDIPKEWIPDGVEYKFVRTDNFGDPDTGRQIQSAREGWTPVPASRHPQLNFTGLFANREQNPYIQYKGATLCERPVEECQKERDYYNKLNYEKITSLPGADNFMGEASMPVRDNSETYLTRARSIS